MVATGEDEEKEEEEVEKEEEEEMQTHPSPCLSGAFIGQELFQKIWSECERS